jgi:hypothetical protein
MIEKVFLYSAYSYHVEIMLSVIGIVVGTLAYIAFRKRK